MHLSATAIQPSASEPKGWACCRLPVVPLRAEPLERSEMVSQILYGERMVILHVRNDWSLVRLENDGYQGWSPTKTIHLCTHDEWLLQSAAVSRVLNQPVSRCSTAMGLAYLPAGSQLFPEDVLLEGTLLDLSTTISPSVVANQFINTPYLWGGKTIFGMDCSGLAQLVYAFNGLRLPRDATDQAKVGVCISTLQQAQADDLAFFHSKGKVVHVGVLVDNHTIIHASGSVRLDRLDETGILNVDSGHYSHQLSHVQHLLV